MILRSKVTCLQATHVPASEYQKDGATRRKPESWECLLKYEDEVYSRAKKIRVRRMVEEFHESKVEMRVGVDYEVTVEPGVSFGNLRLTVVDAKEIKVSTPAKI